MRWGIVVSVILLAAVSLIPAAASAGNWAVGADFGFNVFMPSSDYETANNVTTIGWPASSGVGGLLMGIPAGGGLRLSFTGEKPTHEVYVNTNLSFLSTENGSLHQFQGSLNYQYNFATQGPLKPYVTMGAGLNRVGDNPDEGDGISANSAVFGGGLGLAHTMGHGAGRLRAEVRYDQQTEGTDSGDVLIAKGGAVGFKLGFDLWGKKL